MMGIIPRVATFRPGQVIVEHDQPVHAILLIVQGSVKVEPQGQSRTFVFGPGVPLGLHDIISGREHPVFRGRATALDLVEAVVLDVAAFEKEFRTLPFHLQAIFKSALGMSVAIGESYEEEARNEMQRELAGEMAKLLSAP